MLSPDQIVLKHKELKEKRAEAAVKAAVKATTEATVKATVKDVVPSIVGIPGHVKMSILNKQRDG